VLDKATKITRRSAAENYSDYITWHCIVVFKWPELQKLQRPLWRYRMNDMPEEYRHFAICVCEGNENYDTLSN